MDGVCFLTARLVVRHFRPDDVDALFAVCNDPDVMRWVGDGTPLTRAQCGEWIEVSLRNYAGAGHGNFAVDIAATGEFAGYAGIVYGPQLPEPEIIYAFAQRYWGKRYASELIPALLEFGLNQCGLETLIATIAPENTFSQRIVERAGMQFDCQILDEDGLPMRVYRSCRSE